MGGFIRTLRLRAPGPGSPPRVGYPWRLPAVAALSADSGLALHPRITYLVGENGCGKSTLLEALAVACGMNPEGGSSSFNYATRESHSPLGDELSLVRTGLRWGSDFFLRAESLFTTASYLETLDPGPGGRSPLHGYGGRSLHEQSHGESFLAVLLHRLSADGLYLLDEPEAALSAQNKLTALRRIDELVGEGAQFVIATHSPLILSHPDALIYELAADAAPEVIAYESADAVRLTRAFLADRERFLTALLTD